MQGWIKLHRSLLEWEWYDDLNATRLLIHLLISVNYQDKKWRGISVKAGSMILSWSTLSEGCGLSVRQARIAMDKLEASGEVTRNVTNKYQVVSLVKWDKLQGEDFNSDKQNAIRTADKRQTNGRQAATTKESKEYKEVKEEKNSPLENFEKNISAYALLQNEKPTEVQSFEMQNKNQVQNWEDCIANFNDTVEIEISKGKIEFKSEQLMPRLRKWTRSWLSNQSESQPEQTNHNPTSNIPIG